MRPPCTPSTKLRIFVEARAHFRHHVLAVDEDRPVRAVAQRDVQDGAILGVLIFSPANIARSARAGRAPPRARAAAAASRRRLAGARNRTAGSARCARSSRNAAGRREQVAQMRCRICSACSLQRMPGRESRSTIVTSRTSRADSVAQRRSDRRCAGRPPRPNRAAGRRRSPKRLIQPICRPARRPSAQTRARRD